jgi:hypothetical protein
MKQSKAHAILLLSQAVATLQGSMGHNETADTLLKRIDELAAGDVKIEVSQQINGLGEDFKSETSDTPATHCGCGSNVCLLRDILAGRTEGSVKDVIVKIGREYGIEETGNILQAVVEEFAQDQIVKGDLGTLSATVPLLMRALIEARKELRNLPKGEVKPDTKAGEAETATIGGMEVRVFKSEADVTAFLDGLLKGKQ